MLACVGDVHRSFGLLERLVGRLPRAVQAVVQVGDLGLTRADVERLADGGPPPLRLDRPVHWIDGNWDDFGGLGLRDLDVPTALAPGLVYVPRGTVLELGGLRIGCLGGAESLDGERSRARGVDWWPDLEGVTDADVTRLVRAATRTRGVDLLVAHTPPAPTVAAMTGRPAHPSAVRVHQAQAALGWPPVVAGHMHRSWQDVSRRVQVLDELEARFIDGGGPPTSLGDRTPRRAEGGA